MEINYNYNNGTILKFLRKVLNEINQEYVDSGMRTAFLLKRYIEKYKTDSELGPKHVLLCMMKDIGLFYMNGEVPDDDPAKAAASSYTFLEHCSPLGVAARPLLFYKAKYIENQPNDDYDLGLLMTLLNDVVMCIYESYNVDEIEEFLKDGKEKGYYKPDQVRKTIKLLRDDDTVLSKLYSESNLYVYETQKYISSANFEDEDLEGFIDTTSFAFEFHNHETLAHTITTAEIAYELALKCKLTKETADVIKIAARVHDIGKIRVPREVLCYPGRLEGEMLEEMQRHVVYTKEIIEGSFSYKIVDIAARHHEKLDGSGYPNGLKNIDLSSSDKILAVADICSALYCRRSYKAAFDDEKIMDILLGDAKNGKIDLRTVNHLIDNFDEIMAKAKEEEKKVIEKYNAMKAEYEALIVSPALMHFFDIPENKEPEPVVEETEEEALVEVNADAQLTEEFLEEISSEEYEIPDNTFDEDDLYQDSEVVYVDENGTVIEDYVDEESPTEEEPAHYEDVEEYFDSLEEANEEIDEPEDESDEFADFLDSIPDKEEERDDEFSEFLDSIPDKEEEQEELDEFSEFLDSIPNKQVDISEEDLEHEPIEEVVENDSLPTVDEEIDEFTEFLDTIPDSTKEEILEELPEAEEDLLDTDIEENQEDEQDEFAEFLESIPDENEVLSDLNDDTELEEEAYEDSSLDDELEELLPEADLEDVLEEVSKEEAENTGLNDFLGTSTVMNDTVTEIKINKDIEEDTLVEEDETLEVDEALESIEEQEEEKETFTLDYSQFDFKELERQIYKERYMDFEAIGDYACDFGLDYKTAVLLLAGIVTPEQAVELANRYEPYPFVETDDIEEVCDYIAEVAKEMSNADLDDEDLEHEPVEEIDEFAEFLDSIPDADEFHENDNSIDDVKENELVDELFNQFEENLDEETEDDNSEADLDEYDDDSEDDLDEDDEDDSEDDLEEEDEEGDDSEDDLDEEDDDDDDSEDDLDEEDEPEEFDNIDDEIYDDEEWARYVAERDKKN